MKGFKNTTRTQYSMGGDVYAKGGMAKGAAKISKVMGEFKKGELHSGSKDGPKVTKPAQAKAIAMSEARKAGMKAPMKKNEGGKVGKMPPLGESVKSGNRMSKMTAAERLAMEARFGEKKRPSPADSAKSANRISAQEAAEARHLGVFNEGGKVRKYAEGGPVAPVKKKALPTYNASAAYQQFGADLKRMIDSGQLTLEQANALKAPAFEATRLRDAKQQQQAMDAALAGARGQMSKPSFNASAAYQDFGRELKGLIDSGQLTLEQANALKGDAFQATRYRDVGQQQEAMKAALAGARGRMEAMIPTAPRGLSGLALEGLKNASIMKEPLPMMKPPLMMEMPAPMYGDGPLRPTTAQLSEYNAGGGKGAWDPVSGVFTTSPPPPPPRKIYEPQRPPRMPPTAQPEMPADFWRLPPGVPGFEQQYAQPPMTPPMTPPPLQKLGQGLQRIQQKQRPGMDRVDPGFAIDRGGYGMTGMTTPGGPPPAGMAPVDPRNVTMMKHGGRAAMPKGKR